VLAALRKAVDDRADDLHDLAARLVRERSLLGAEEGAQRVVEERLRRLGFGVERVEPDAGEALRDPHAGYPLLPYEGRTCVAGRIEGSGGGRSLHLSGHVDVVPVEAEERWTHDPWGGEIAGGRLWGRGAGDMKSGVAAYLVGVEVFLEAAGEPRGDLLFTSVIEEECGGNGMRAVLRAGYDADATLIGEPTDLRLHANGVGVIWARLVARSEGAHAAVADASVSPVEQLFAAVRGLRALEARLNEGAPGGHPYNLNLGEIRGGVWPSSVPAEVVLRARLGFGPELEPGAAQQLLREAVEREAPAVEVSFEGFRAYAYEHDLANPLAALVSSCHAELHGAPPGSKVSTATTDARYVEGPCLCYGPTAGNIHATDEWVDLQSVRDTALAVALILLRWDRSG
jgi:acetylornithine deacetylase